MDSLMNSSGSPPAYSASIAAETGASDKEPLLVSATVHDDADDEEADDAGDSTSFLSPGGTSTLRERGTKAPSVPASKRFKSFVSKVDLFPKAEEEVTVRTESGVIVSVATLVVIVFLFLSELSSYLTVQTREHMVVDTLAGERLNVYLDVEFPALPCSACQFDVMAVTGEHHESIEQDMDLIRILPSGERVKVRNADEAAAAETPGEGCRVNGFVQVTKVAGNFHVAVGRVEANSVHHRHKFALGELKAFNASHTIHNLAFGQTYPGQPLPLNGVAAVARKGPTQYQYFIKVVPTTYRSQSSGSSFTTNQYSVTARETVIDASGGGGAGGASGIPSVFFIYDFSPFRVVVEEGRMPLTHFIVSVCAIVGGVLTVAGIFHSLYYHGKKIFTVRRDAAALETSTAEGQASMQALLSGGHS